GGRGRGRGRGRFDPPPWRKVSARLWNLLPLPFARMAASIERAGAGRPAAASLPLSKICDRRDWEHPAWRQAFEDLGYRLDPARLHRQEWEVAPALYGLRMLRRACPAAPPPRPGAPRAALTF